MVNVGGRSKGCSTCRKRRVKCDETRPVCNRCKFQNLPCDGPRDITFVQGTIVKSRRSLPKPKVTNLKVIKSEDVHDVVTHIPSFALQGDPLERYICYGRRYFKPGAPLDVLSEKLQPHDLNMLAKGKAHGQIFDQAMLSFATVVFGFEHKQSCIMQQGYAVHSSALQTLSTTLRSPDCVGSDEVLLAVVALTMLESVVPTSPQSYLRHVIGLDNLLALRDPEEHASPWSLLIYRSIRHFMLFGALRASRPSVFALPQWKKVLRTGCSTDELLEQDLWDILADCTVLYANRLVADDVSSVDLQAALLLSQLSAWRDQWEATHGNPIIGSVRSCMETSQGPIPSLPKSQMTVDIATKLILYNSTLLHVLQILRAFPSSCNQTAAEVQAATEICHGVSSLSAGKPLMTSNVSPVAQWGISIAWETLKNRGSVEALWLGDLIRSKKQNVLAKGLFEG